MFERQTSSLGKAKGKIQISKAVNQLSNILPAQSQIRKTIQNICPQEKIDCIHETEIDAVANKKFIKTDFNRLLDSQKLGAEGQNQTAYRSPYTNQYFPEKLYENAKGNFPSPIIRDLEQKGNILFAEYSKLYYGENDCLSNFYVFESQEGLNVMFVLKKDYTSQELKGVWSSTNGFEIRGDPLKSVTYKLQTTVLYQFEISMGSEDSEDNLKVSGTLKKNKVEAKKFTQESELDEFHLLACGRLVEETETLLRQQLESVFLAKSNEMVSKNRAIDTKPIEKERTEMGRNIFKMRTESTRKIDLDK